MTFTFPTAVVTKDLTLTKNAIELLHVLSGVDCLLLEKVKLRPANANWLRAPWYSSYKGGGAMTIGHTIYFTRNWFSEDRYQQRNGRNVSYGRNDTESIFMWLKLLTHEVGHLPQAHNSGYHFLGKINYLFQFTKGYAVRLLTFQKNIHDGFSLEITAEIGQYVFDCLFTEKLSNDGYLMNTLGRDLCFSLIQNDELSFQEILSRISASANSLQKSYRDKNWKHFERENRIFKK